MREEPEHETVVADRDPPARAKRWRIALLVVLFFGSLAIAKVTGLDSKLDIETVRSFMSSAGAWGFVLFVVIFAVGELMHVPGMVFVLAAAVAYGALWGSIASYAGAMVSVATTFIVVRAVGGQPLGDIRRPIMRKILARLEERPVVTVAILRTLFFMAPALNYGLAMSPITLRRYLTGSALGLLVPIPAMVLLADWIIATFF